MYEARQARMQPNDRLESQTRTVIVKHVPLLNFNEQVTVSASPPIHAMPAIGRLAKKLFFSVPTLVALWRI